MNLKLEQTMRGLEQGFDFRMAESETFFTNPTHHMFHFFLRTACTDYCRTVTSSYSVFVFSFTLFISFCAVR